MIYHLFFIQDLSIFVTGDPIDNVNQVTSLFLPKDQIIYSSSASSSTRTRALNIDLSKSVELRKCSSICSFSRLLNLVFWEYLVNPWWYMLIICLPIRYQWKDMEDHLCLFLSSFVSTACVQSLKVRILTF